MAVARVVEVAYDMNLLARTACVAIIYDAMLTNRDWSKNLTAVSVALMIFAALSDQLAFSVEVAKTNSKPLKYEEPRVLAGRIYAKGGDGKNLLFNFSRRATRNGAALQVLREYTHPDGKLAARERVSYHGDNLVSYELEELQMGARGRAEIRRDQAAPAKGRIQFEYSNNAGSDGKPNTDSESLQKETLINDMVGPFLASHWDALIRGHSVKCRYIVVPRTETVGFTFGKGSESKWEGRKVIVIKMAATSPVIAALVDPIFFKVEMNEPHRVFTYEGRTTPKIKAGGKWKDLDALTVFDWEQSTLH